MLGTPLCAPFCVWGSAAEAYLRMIWLTLCRDEAPRHVGVALHALTHPIAPTHTHQCTHSNAPMHPRDLPHTDWAASARERRPAGGALGDHIPRQHLACGARRQRQCIPFPAQMIALFKLLGLITGAVILHHVYAYPGSRSERGMWPVSMYQPWMPATEAAARHGC